MIDFSQKLVTQSGLIRHLFLGEIGHCRDIFSLIFAQNIELYIFIIILLANKMIDYQEL